MGCRDNTGGYAMKLSLIQCDRCGKKEQISQSAPDDWSRIDSLKGQSDLCEPCAMLVTEFIKTKGDTTTSLKKMIESDHKELMRRTHENSQLAGMLADIYERIFGENSRGAPKILAYQHCSWMCGPGTKTKDTFLEESGSDKDEEWDDFLSSLPEY